jgi:hypothetical protein
MEGGTCSEVSVATKQIHFRNLNPFPLPGNDPYTVLVTVARLRAGGFGFRFPAEEDIFLLYKTSRSAVGLTQPPIQWAPGALSPGLEIILETCFFQLI